MEGGTQWYVGEAVAVSWVYWRQRGGKGKERERGCYDIMYCVHIHAYIQCMQLECQPIV